MTAMTALHKRRLTTAVRMLRVVSTGVAVVVAAHALVRTAIAVLALPLSVAWWEFLQLLGVRTSEL